MNEHDRNNLNFLLSSDSEAIKTWITVVSEDELTYAWELLAKYSQELEERATEMVVEANLERLNGKYSEASNVINQLLGKSS